MWDDYKTLLEDMLLDPITREALQASRYDHAQQKTGQSVKQFISYLEELKSDLPPYSEAHQRQHIYTKLLPGLYRVLANY